MGLSLAKWKPRTGQHQWLMGAKAEHGAELRHRKKKPADLTQTPTDPATRNLDLETKRDQTVLAGKMDLLCFWSDTPAQTHSRPCVAAGPSFGGSAGASDVRLLPHVRPGDLGYWSDWSLQKRVGHFRISVRLRTFTDLSLLSTSSSSSSFSRHFSIVGFSTSTQTFLLFALLQLFLKPLHLPLKSSKVCQHLYAYDFLAATCSLSSSDCC